MRLAKTVVRAAIAAALGAARVRAQESDPPKHEHHAMEHAQADSASKVATSDDTQPSPPDYVPPLPPQHAMESMSGHDMTDAMEMDDAASIATLRFDRLERTEGAGGVATTWKLAATAGGDFDKLLVRSEGELVRGEFERSDIEGLWSHAVAAYWDTQVGVRRDFGSGADRSWAAFGVQGLTPYWFEVGATAYVGDGGRAALRFEVDYDLSLTQRLILQPRIEFNAYSRSDPVAHVGSGVSDAGLGLRLRYEIAREVAPYIGVERSCLFGDAADMARLDGKRAAETKWVIGLRFWY